MVEGVLWRLRTGALWRDLPERYGPWERVYTRFRRWQAAGVWDEVSGCAPGRRRRPWRAGLGSALPGRHEYPGAPTRGGGAQKGGADQALGRSRGGGGAKLHLRTDRHGKPITWTLTPGQTQEATQVAALLEQGAIARSGRGRPRVRPDRVAGDKGYTGRRIRGYLRHRGIGTVIPRQRSKRAEGCASTALPIGNAIRSSARSTGSSSTGRSRPATKSWRRPIMRCSPSPRSSSGCRFENRP